MLFNYFNPVFYNGAYMADVFHSFKTYFDQAASGYIKRKFIITGSPRPELLSYNLYGSTEYYWVLLMLNNIYDPYYDWVMSEEAVQQYSMIKYQNLEQKQYTVLYHVDPNGKKYWRMKEYPAGSLNWYDIGDTYHQYPQHVGSLVPVTAVEHEIDLNEGRRIVDIIAPSDISAFVDDLTRIMEKMKYGY